MKNPIVIFCLLFVCLTSLSAQLWTPLNFPSSAHLQMIDFSSDLDGVVAEPGSTGEIWITGDRGDTWQQIPISDPQFTLEDINLRGSDTLLASGYQLNTGDSKLYYSKDRGQNWNDITPAGFSTYGGISEMASSTLFYASGRSGRVFKTTDAGQNWTTVQSQIVLEGAFDMAVVDDRIFLAVQYSIPQTFITKDMLLYSHDAGANWDTLEVTRYESFKEIDFISPDVGFLLSYRGLYRTTDGGLTWNEQTINLSQPFFQGMDMQTATDGFLAATNEMFFFNGSANVNQEFFDLDTVFRAVANPGANAFGCGQDGLVMRRGPANGRGEELEGINVDIFPNPFQESINVEMETSGAYEIVDLTGKELQEGTLLRGGNKLILKGANPGTYILRIEDEQGRKISRMIFLEQ